MLWVWLWGWALAGEPESADDWLAAVDAPLAGVPGMRWAVHRRVTQGEARLDERWRMTWDQGGRFRIDYFGDTVRQVARDGDVLVDYLPATGRARRFQLDALEPAERDALLAQVLGKVTIPGLRTGGEVGLSWTVAGEEVVEGRQAVLLEGRDGDDLRLRYAVDRERRTLLRSEGFDAGRNALRTVASGFQEVNAAVWLPQQVELWTPEALVTVRLSRVEVLEDPSPALFQLDLAPTVAVDTWP